MIEIGYPFGASSKLFLKTEDRSSPLCQFVKNELLEGKILKTFASQNVLLLIKGQKVLAKTDLPLTAGKLLSFKVEQVLPVPILKIMGEHFSGTGAINRSTILAALKDNIWKSVFENLKPGGPSHGSSLLFRELLTDLSLRFFTSSDPELLKLLIETSGLSWEKKLRDISRQKKIGADRINRLINGDLKGFGFKLLAEQTEPEPLTERLVSSIKNFQLLNHVGLQQQGKIFLPVPIQFCDGLFTVGQLLIHLGRERDDGRESDGKRRALVRLSCVLDLSTLGPLRADITVQANVIEGRFLLSEKSAKALVEENLPVLIANLKAKGFLVQNIGCYLQKPEIINQPLIHELIEPEGCSFSMVV